MKKIIAGVDEVGRGSLIGPVYAAAVILKERIDKKKLKDSKKLSKKCENRGFWLPKNLQERSQNTLKNRAHPTKKENGKTHVKKKKKIGTHQKWKKRET